MRVTRQGGGHAGKRGGVGNNEHHDICTAQEAVQLSGAAKNLGSLPAQPWVGLQGEPPPIIAARRSDFQAALSK